MTTQETTLANGLRIITVNIADARSLTTNIVVGTGSRYEDFAVNGGVSHFLEHLLFKGSKKYPTAEAIAVAVDAVGGYNNAYTSEDITSFYIKVPAIHGALALDILTDMMRNPLMDPTEVDRERGVIVEEMNVYRDDPARFVGIMIPALMFPHNPLGKDIIGSEAVINSISTPDIVAYQKYHYQPRNMVIAVAGQVDHAAVVKLAEAALGDLEGRERAKIQIVGDDLATDLAVTQAKDTAQAHFIVAARSYPYNHPDDRAAKVMSAILGRGMSSRLFMNVRERQGLAYTVYSEINNYIDTGIFQAYAGVNLDKIDQALTSVLHELTVICEQDVTAAELAKAKQQLRAGLEMSLESNNAIADRIGSQLVLTGQVKSVDQVISEIEAVTIGDVRRVAIELLKPSKLRFAIIAPEPEHAAEHFKSIVTKGQ
jgi:predicted Zn-dependent peptidase